MKIPSALVLAFVLAAAGCGQSAAEKEGLRELQDLKVERAQADATAALARGDKRLLAIYGLTVEVPGTNYTAEQAGKANGIRILEGTSDTPEGDEEAELNLRARAYAASFNRTILSRPR